MRDTINSHIPAVGQTAPDFEVLTYKNEDFQLTQALTPARHLMLVFYRGYW